MERKTLNINSLKIGIDLHGIILHDVCPKCQYLSQVCSVCVLYNSSKLYMYFPMDLAQNFMYDLILVRKTFDH